MGLLVLGLTVVPAQVTQARLSGTHQYVATLPVPRLAPLAAEVTFWLLVQLPGTVLALVIARLRFDVGLHVGPAVVPAIALTALTAASVGYAVAVSLPPEVANQLTSFLSLGLLLFSPINFPASRLPSVARAIHSVLPVQYMADIVRGSLTGRYVDPPLLAYVVVVAWCVVGLAAGHRAATRRP
jgi:ABC-2 type transport system permease protein